MRQNFRDELAGRMAFLVGSADIAARIREARPREIFDEAVVDFLNDLSRVLMKRPEARPYSDVVTFAFWIRRASVMQLKDRFTKPDGLPRLGRGAAFHIAPSNVPVNFAYSLAAGLLCGNANIVRVPGRDFAQVDILAGAMGEALERHPEMKPYILLVRYGHDREINDALSALADVRIIWGGDHTIGEIRKSPLPPRAVDIAFADRFSMAVIDSDAYLALPDKAQAAKGFYDDTFLTDQNACTSPRLIVWMGEHIDEAKAVFWEMAHALAAEKYAFQPIQGVDKLALSCRIAAERLGTRIEPHADNLIIRVKVPEPGAYLMENPGNSGFFYEYNCRDILELLPVCGDSRCQTIGYIGEKETFLPLLRAGARGIDRLVPMGKTMDFDLIWDGDDLPAMLSRTVGWIG